MQLATIAFVAPLALASLDAIATRRGGYSLPRLPIATRKVGGIRFLKVGRLTFSVCVSREFKPFK